MTRLELSPTLAVPGWAMSTFPPKFPPEKLMPRALAENANCFHAMGLSRLLPHYSVGDFPLHFRPTTVASRAMISHHKLRIRSRRGTW
jgi:hypothetical protein